MELKDRELLLALIQSRRHSQRDVAKAAGWKSHSYLLRLLSGEAKTLKPDPAIAIAEFLGVPADLLFMPRVDRKNEHSVRESRKVPA